VLPVIVQQKPSAMAARNGAASPVASPAQMRCRSSLFPARAQRRPMKSRSTYQNISATDEKSSSDAPT